MVAAVKPRLLFFNGPWDYLEERLRHSYIAPLRRLLEQDFQVISVEGDCDFKQQVDRHQPDLVMFHTGTESPQERGVTITHTDAYPDLPRIGYISRDPFSPSRLAPMNRLRIWGVHEVFVNFRATDCPTPFFDDAMYLVWWIDDTLFRDYGEPKTVPISLTGAGWVQQQFYTWRLPVLRELTSKLPVYHVPPFAPRNGEGYFGEAYARLLNRSRISGGCGSVCRYLTLKLLEIPAARSCLITEETEVVKAMGFRDGVNCLFVTESDVAERVQGLLDDPARLQAITDAGHELVHRHHTQRNRRVFAEWFDLWRARQPGQRVVQVNPVEPLQLVDAGAPMPTRTFPVENPLTASLVEGYRLVEAAQWKAAQEKFEWVLRNVPYVAEARLGTAICHLHQGQPKHALAHLRQDAESGMKNFAYDRPDPVSHAYHVISAMRAGDGMGALQMIVNAAGVKHPALNALRWVVAEKWKDLKRKSPAFHVTEGDESQNAETVHIVPRRNFAAWASLWSGYLAS